MKRFSKQAIQQGLYPFSILERIDVGETNTLDVAKLLLNKLSVSSNGSTWVKRVTITRRLRIAETFSILERIDVGETIFPWRSFRLAQSFSILERIDVGETF